jgi:hypothetical protein
MIILSNVQAARDLDDVSHERRRERRTPHGLVGPFNSPAFPSEDSLLSPGRIPRSRPSLPESLLHESHSSGCSTNPPQRVVFDFPDLQHYVSFDQVSRLLVRMCVIRKDAAPPQMEFGHQCTFAEDECLQPDPRKRLRVLFSRVFLKHDDVPFSWPNK